MSRLNFRRGAVDNPGVDQVSRPMQIALVAVVLLAGMWFTVLKPKPAEDSSSFTPTPAASAPGTTGLSNAVDKAKAASKTSDAANAKIQSATGGTTKATITKAPATKAATPTKATATKAKVTKAAATTTATKKATTTAPAKAKAVTTAAATKPKTKAVDVDPSTRLLAYLAKGKTLVVLFEGKGVDDKAARTAVHKTAKSDPKHVVSAYVPIGKVGDYDALTSDIQIFQAPSILVIGADRKAKLLTGYVDTRSVQQAVGDARRAAAASAKK